MLLLDHYAAMSVSELRYRYRSSQCRYRSLQVHYRGVAVAEYSGRYSLVRWHGYSIGNLFGSEQDVKRAVTP